MAQRDYQTFAMLIKESGDNIHFKSNDQSVLVITV